jgi:D-alanyl-D-alanine carboxypeptidase
MTPNNLEHYGYALLALFLLGGIMLGIGEMTRLEPVFTEEEVQTTIAPASDFFSPLNLHAKAVAVYDLRFNRMLFNKNDEVQLPLASLTKLMTAIVSEEILSEHTSVSINGYAAGTGDSTGLQTGEIFSLRDLLDITLIASSNRGARALASAAGASILKATPTAGTSETSAFINRMNARAEELNLTQTYFVEPSGLDPAKEVAGGSGSARDMAHLMAYLVTSRPELIEVTTYQTLDVVSESTILHRVQNTNQYLNDIPALIASKTGLTDLAGGNLLVAFDAGMERPIIIVVLSSTEEGRFSDVSALAQAALACISASCR